MPSVNEAVRQQLEDPPNYLLAVMPDSIILLVDRIFAVSRTFPSFSELPIPPRSALFQLLQLPAVSSTSAPEVLEREAGFL